MLGNKSEASMSDETTERQRREMVVRNAIASYLLEGLVPKTGTIANLHRYANGLVTIDELIADAKRRHTGAT